jgi:hypothetical protein
VAHLANNRDVFFHIISLRALIDTVLFTISVLLFSVFLPRHGVCAAISDDASFYGMSRKEISDAVLIIHKDYPRLSDRVIYVSARFLGTPYHLGPLGEGAKARFDKKPRITFKAVDCTTLVEETMALSLSGDFADATRLLDKIRYDRGHVSYLTRNHFPSADWIPNNIAAGFLKDITAQIAGPKLKTASKLISKRRWYAQKTATDLDISGKISQKERETLLKSLRSLGKNIPDQKVAIAYLPIQYLPEALGRIPSGTIANLVREDQADKSVLISHQVFIIKKDGVAYVRHAAWNKSVKDVPALMYFYRYFNSNWKLLGLNFLQVVDSRHH